MKKLKLLSFLNEGSLTHAYRLLFDFPYTGVGSKTLSGNIEAILLTSLNRCTGIKPLRIEIHVTTDG